MFGLRFASNLATAVTLLFCAGVLHAADAYPSKPGRLILPFGAGASTDIIGRIFAQRFSEAWGQTLVVDNRPGAGGTLGTALAAKAAPDGYTIFTYGINQTITPNLYKSLPYDPQRDFIPVSLYAAMMKALASPDLKQRFFENGVSAALVTPEEFVKFIGAEYAKWKKAVALAGAKVE